VLLGISKIRNVTTSVITSVCVLVGMWLERYLIAVPSLSMTRLASATSFDYKPTWVEIGITVATFAGMVLLYLIFAKLVPIIAIWEFKPEQEEA